MMEFRSWSNMTTSKNKGKRPVVDDIPCTRKKSTASGTRKAGAHASISGLSDSQQRKKRNNATKVFSGGRFDSAVKSSLSSKSKNDCRSFVCEICVERKNSNESFSIQGCSHAYCTNCVVKYVSSKLQENITSIPCPLPDCNGLLEPEHCRNILPQDVFDRWAVALCEAMIPGAQKFYCPFKDCSALLINDGGEAIKESECPHCNRLFCAECKVPWHAGIDCTEFQRLNKDERGMEDIMLMKLAQSKKWKRCPSCRFYVEKKDGCMFMKCRCGKAFCYNCGALFSGISHLCPKCMH